MTPITPTPEEIAIAAFDQAIREIPMAPTIALVDLAAPAPPVKEKEDSSKPRCPKCGTFMEVVKVANDDHLPGLYCNKEECGQAMDLPQRVPQIRDHFSFLNPSVIQLINAAPQNPTARAHVHAIMGKPVPRSCVTAEQIYRWVNTVEIGKRISASGLSIGVRPPTSNHTLSMEVTLRYTEHGTCRYHSSRSGSANYELSEQRILQLATRCSTLNELRDIMANEYKNLCSDDRPDTEERDIDYDDHEETEDDDNYQYQINQERLYHDLVDWLQEYAPDTLEELEGNE